MGFDSVASAIQDSLTVRRVFGEPYERDGVTVIPVAAVRGGGGGGRGEREHPGGDEEEGEGGGFGLMAKPVGVYVIRGGEVCWQPALDLNRVIVGGQLVALAALLVARRAVKRRSVGQGQS